MCVGWVGVVNAVLIYSYVWANKNSQTVKTGPGAVLQKYSQKLWHGLCLLKVFTGRFQMHIDLRLHQGQA